MLVFFLWLSTPFSTSIIHTKRVTDNFEVLRLERLSTRVDVASDWSVFLRKSLVAHHLEVSGLGLRLGAVNRGTQGFAYW